MKEFLLNFARGAVIGVAMIIPGVSGGTAAVIFGIYEKMISAVSNLRRDFKNSFLYLLPILLGAITAVAAMYFPIRYALEYVPLPTVLLFVGLMIGSVPKLFKDGLHKGFGKLNALSLIIPFAVVIGVCFIPSLGNVNLGMDMPVYGYFLLAVMGVLAACALVVPGISGSMLLLIFGYYKPILDTVSAMSTHFGHSALVLVIFAFGGVVGFFGISKLMKLFLSKFPRGTYWAIIGFVLGSVPAVFITFDYAGSPLGKAHIIVGIVLCVVGILCSYILTGIADRKIKNMQTDTEG